MIANFEQKNAIKSFLSIFPWVGRPTKILKIQNSDAQTPSVTWRNLIHGQGTEEMPEDSQVQGHVLEDSKVI